MAKLIQAELDRLSAIRERNAARSPGTWFAENKRIGVENRTIGEMKREEDALFAAYGSVDIPFLLELVDRLASVPRGGGKGPKESEELRIGKALRVEVNA